jgi:hypothetical protein
MDPGRRIAVGYVEEDLCGASRVAILSRVNEQGGVSMAVRTTYICDCCFRESDNNLGWAHLHINGASGGKQLMPDDDRDLCEICWSPMQTLMKKVHAEAQERRNSGEARDEAG